MQLEQTAQAMREAIEGGASNSDLVAMLAGVQAAERDRIARHMADCFESLARRWAGHGELTAELWKAVATMRA
jgi:deoxyribose-phosphate aldolase